MDNFKKGGFRGGSGGSGGRPSFGGNKKFGNKFGGGGRDRGGRDRGPMQLYPAVCSDCRKNCEVPFRPTGDKPVYCRDCFGKQQHVPGRNSNGADGPRQDFNHRDEPQREYQPQPARPQSDPAIDALKRQLEALESKVNRILELVSQKPALQAPVEIAAPKPVKAKVSARKVIKGKK